MKTFFFCLLISFFSSISYAQIKWKPGLIGYANDNSNYTRPKTRGDNSLVSSYSLKEFAPPTGSQDTFGTCVGWATTYAAMTILENIQNQKAGVNMNASECYSPQLTYDLCKYSSDDDCSQGLYVANALNALKYIGAMRMSDYPIQCNNNGQRFGIQRLYDDSAKREEIVEMMAKVKSVRLKGFIPLVGANIVDNVKYYLSRKMPVVIGAEMYSSLNDNRVSNVWTGVTDDYSGGHAMCVIGYDDNKQGGAFEVMNSWGSDWADSGYIWIRYSDFAKVVDVAYALTGLVKKNESETQAQDFDISISATGVKSSRLLPIKKKQANINDLNLKASLGGLVNQYSVNYSEGESGFRLNLSANVAEAYHVYGFFIKSGDVSLITPISNVPKLLDQVGSGVIIPSDQSMAISLPNSPFDIQNICLLICKRSLDVDYLMGALSKQYASLEDFIWMNFSSDIALNKAVSETNYDGKIRIKDEYEINDIMPLFFTSNMSKQENTSLFEEINISDNLDFESRYELKLALDDFEKNNDEYNYKIYITTKKENSTMKFAVTCYRSYSLDIVDDISVDLEDDFEEAPPAANKTITYKSGKRVQPYLFKYSFTGSTKNMTTILKKTLSDKLITNKVRFKMAN